MENGVKVRSIEELKDNFSIVKIMEYLKDGKLFIWLKDRYLADIADSVDKLDLKDKELAKKLCEIFDVTYNETIEKELKKDNERIKRIKKLKEYTDNVKYEKVIDNIAFNQNELYELLDNKIHTIYLCGKRFFIPLMLQNMTYIGINNPVVVIDSKIKVNWSEKNISVEGVRFDRKYQRILNYASKDNFEKTVLGDYKDNSYLSNMISATEKENAKKLYQTVKEDVMKLSYDIDDDIKSLKKIAEKNEIINLAEEYIQKL